MSNLLNFIKDWIPSIGVIVAGAWIFFQWLFSESIRRQREGPALDGNLSQTSVPFGHGKVLLTISAIWNNRGPFPIYLDLNKTRITIFRIDPNINKTNSPLVLKQDLGEPICDYKFLLEVCEVNYFFEPNTTSTLINYFILEPGIYGVRMELHTPVRGENWWKESIVDTRSSTVTKLQNDLSE